MKELLSNSFKQAKRVVNMKCVSELNVANTNIHKNIKNYLVELMIL
jgi:hypothetical protein